MKRKLSTSEKVRRLIDQGHTNKAIIEKLGIKPQVVYNMRYQLNKARGLGAIGQAAPTPTEGIGAPPKKRNYTRKVPAGTGINPPVPNPAVAERDREFKQALVEETLRHHPEFLDKPPFKTPGSITMYEPPSLWQRIRGWFRA